MPKTTTFEIRDIRPEAGYVFMPDLMLEKMPEEFQTYVSRMVFLQKNQLGHIPKLNAEGKVVNTSRTIFFKTHETKDVTRIQLGTVFPWLCKCEVMSKVKYLRHSPCFSAGVAVGSFDAFAIYSSILGPTDVTRTNYDDVTDNGRICNVFRKELDGLLCRDALPILPVIANTPDGGIEVALSRPKGVTGSVYIGISISPLKVCLGCFTQATPETSGQYKKCKRCWEAMEVAVWYCSVACQVFLSHCVGIVSLHLFLICLHCSSSTTRSTRATARTPSCLIWTGSGSSRTLPRASRAPCVSTAAWLLRISTPTCLSSAGAVPTTGISRSSTAARTASGSTTPPTLCLASRTFARFSTSTSGLALWPSASGAGRSWMRQASSGWRTSSSLFKPLRVFNV